MTIQLQDYLHHNIPLTTAMRITVSLASSHKIVLKAPFAPNINHKKTVFGGSLLTAATLACWGLVHVNTQDVQIVITHSDAAFLATVTTDFEAVCTMPAQEEWDRFVTTLQKKGKARIDLRATIHEKNQLCVDYRGTFAAINIYKKSEKSHDPDNPIT